MRFLLPLAGIIMLAAAPAALAHPEGKTEAKPAAKQRLDPSRPITEQIKLPTQKELDEMWAQMPDMNALMGDMMGVMRDPSTKAGMTQSMSIMRETMAGAMENRDENGLPDFNAMMKGMFGLMGNEEFMGGFMGMITPMQEVMEKHAPAEPKDKLPADASQH